MNSIDDYIFIGDHDRSKLNEAHNMVKEFKDNLFSGKESHLIQDIFLNRGSCIDDDKRPSSYFDVTDHVVPRTQIMAGLMYLQGMVQLVTNPQLAIVHKPLIYTDGVSGLITPSIIEDPTTITTPSGMDFAKMDYFQKEWFTRRDIIKDVRELEKNLQSAFEEYNLKWVLSTIYNSHRSFIPNDWKDVAKIASRLKTVQWKDVFCPLDDAYYNTARRYSHNAALVADRLQKDDFGTLFVIAVDDMKEFIRQSQSRMYYD